MKRVIIAAALLAGCGEPDRRKASPAKPGWTCRKFTGPYDHKKVERICEYVKDIHGRPRTRGACEQLANLIQEASVPAHNCDSIECIQFVADEIGLEQFPDCSTLPKT